MGTLDVIGKSLWFFILVGGDNYYSMNVQFSCLVLTRLLPGARIPCLSRLYLQRRLLGIQTAVSTLLLLNLVGCGVAPGELRARSCPVDDRSEEGVRDGCADRAA